MGDYIVLIISCIFVNNILLAQFLGNCPFFGTSKKMETAVGMAMAVIFVLVMAGVITWMVYNYLLVPLGLTYLRTIAFILVIASLVQFVEMFLKKSIPALYAGLAWGEADPAGAAVLGHDGADGSVDRRGPRGSIRRRLRLLPSRRSARGGAPGRAGIR